MMRLYVVILTLMLIATGVQELFGQDCDDSDDPDGCGVVPYLHGIPQCNDTEYTLVFEDEFDGTDLDWEVWEVPYQGVTSDYGFHNSKQWYANPHYVTGTIPEHPVSHNVEVSNGTLKISAREEDPPISGRYLIGEGNYEVSSFDYSSGWIQTKEEFFYGIYEARCRVPEGQGFWAAFWTMGAFWEEIDIFEIYGSDIHDFTCNVHEDTDFDFCSSNCGYSEVMDLDFTDWHTYTTIFTSDRISWYIDDEHVRTLQRFTTLDGTSLHCHDEGISPFSIYERVASPDKPMNVIFNLAVQNGESTHPTESTPFPGVLEVDYVKVWAQEDLYECSNCVDNMTYSNTSNIPSYTAVNHHIVLEESVEILPDQEVVLMAGNSITIDPGATIASSSSVVTMIEPCTGESSENVQFTLIGDNTNDEGSLSNCQHSHLELEVYGSLWVNVKVHNYGGQLVAEYDNPYPEQNILKVWNVLSAATGWYNVEVTALQCDGMYENSYWLFLENCHSPISTSNPINEESYERNDFSLEETFNEQVTFSLNPNPVTDLLHLQFDHQGGKEDARLVVYNSQGVELEKRKWSVNDGGNSLYINMSPYPTGVYFISFRLGDLRIHEQIVKL